MSAVSPAANNTTSLTLDAITRPNPRRRSLLTIEKKSTAETVIEGGTNGTVDANGKDLSHSLRGEAVLERSRDAQPPKKGLATPSPVSPRRKKHLSKRERPKWATALSVLTKNCLLLAALLWVGQMLWKWTDRIGSSPGSPFVALEIEDRISEVEASLKKTAKMLQVQLEVVDRKIGNEVGAAKKELQRVEERGLLLEEELKKLGSRADSLDKSLGELKDLGLLSRDEFERFWNELKNSGSLDGGNKARDLDDIRAIAREIVGKEIEKHAADGLGKVDYALASGGARVVRHSEPFTFREANGWLAVVKGRNGVHANANKMLEPSFGEPGQCFPLKGSSGFVEIRLRTGIIPEAITLEHVTKSVAYDRSSAPKDCRVSAWFKAPEDEESNREDKMFLLAEFSYDLEKSNAQTFNVEGTDPQVVNMIRFDFISNHGSTALTCIYRLRVHGYDPSSAAAMPLQA